MTLTTGPYTPEHEERIRTGFAEGVSDVKLSRELNRSRQSIASKRCSMGLSYVVVDRKPVEPQVAVEWDPIVVGPVTVREYAMIHRIKPPTIEAVNSFRHKNQLPVWNVSDGRWLG